MVYNLKARAYLLWFFFLGVTFFASKAFHELVDFEEMKEEEEEEEKVLKKEEKALKEEKEEE